MATSSTALLVPSAGSWATCAGAPPSRWRCALARGFAAAATPPPPLGPLPPVPRSLVLRLLPPALLLAPASSASASTPPDCTITDRVFLDISECPSSFTISRELPDPPSPSPSPAAAAAAAPPPPPPPPCDLPSSLGRIVIGLFGLHLPRTVANFKAMCTGSAGSSYRGCMVHRVIPGQYIMAGKQGSSKAKGEVLPPTHLDRNPETVRSDAFTLRHSRPGTVSLCLSQNDDDDQFKLSTEYRNVEFLITTGPGPAPQLDNKNIVFGTVLEGLDVVREIAAVPIYNPNERIRQFNELASFLGDERASNARNFWYRPLKAIYVNDCGEL